jgi:ABC-type branched-subunit amino acid transport system ATPase component
MLQVRGLTMRYPNGKMALVDFDLIVGQAELVVVLGGNAAARAPFCDALRGRKAQRPAKSG